MGNDQVGHNVIGDVITSWTQIGLIQQFHSFPTAEDKSEKANSWVSPSQSTLIGFMIPFCLQLTAPVSHPLPPICLICLLHTKHGKKTEQARQELERCWQQRRTLHFCFVQRMIQCVHVCFECSRNKQKGWGGVLSLPADICVYSYEVRPKNSSI